MSFWLEISGKNLIHPPPQKKKEGGSQAVGVSYFLD